MDDWKKMTKDELDHAFSPSRFTQRFTRPDDAVTAHVTTLTRASDTVQSSSPCEMHQYGDTEEQCLHIYLPPAARADCPVFVYIHGGYWQALSLQMSSFAASPLLQDGLAFVALGYDLAPTVSMEEILQQVTTGVVRVLRWAEDRGSRGVYICGHSAGGHLAAMMLSVDWGQHAVNSSLIRGVIPVSGVYDLRPLVDTYVNEPLHMTPASAWSLSPMRHMAQIQQHGGGGVQVLVAHAQHDPPQFHLQSQAFAKAMQEAGCHCELLQVPGTDHFDVIELLRNADYVLTKKISAMMRQG